MRVIRLGDRTSHGGEVITASRNYTIMGKAAAREGDIVTCPIKGHGSGGIIGGDPNWTDDDRAIALERISLAPCGAEIFSSCSELERTFEGDRTAGLGQGLNASASPGLVQQQTALERAERVADSECITTDSPELKNKRLKDYWGTSDPDQIKQIARRMLGIDTAQLPSMAKRRENWQKFVQRHIPREQNFSFELAEQHPDFGRLGPGYNSDAYGYLEKYAMTDYGALMIGKVTEEYERLVDNDSIDASTNFANEKALNSGYQIFRVLVDDLKQARGAANRIELPGNFPKRPTYLYGGQEIDPLAVLHHEFEHTRFGIDSRHDAGDIKEELAAVERLENPVRALSDLEPRYTYVQLDKNENAVKTISIKNPTNEKKLGWKHCMNDITKLTPAEKKE